MKNKATVLSPNTSTGQSDRSLVVGTIVSIDLAGNCQVDAPDSPNGPVRARLARSVAQMPRQAVAPGDEVLLLVDQQGGAPVVVDLVTSRFCHGAGPSGSAEELIIDGQRLVLKAGSQLELRCGRGSIVITREGKIVLKGERLLSEALGTNAIKGGTIELN